MSEKTVIPPLSIQIQNNLPNFVFVLDHIEAAGDYGVIALFPDLFWLGQSLPGTAAVSLVKGHRPLAARAYDAVAVHEEHVDPVGVDLGAVAVAGEGGFDPRAPGVDAPEVSVELEVVLVGVHHRTVRLVVAQHDLAQV